MMIKKIQKFFAVFLLFLISGISGCVSTPVKEKSIVHPTSVKAVQETIAPRDTAKSAFLSEKQSNQLPPELFSKYAPLAGLRLDLAAVVQALYQRLVGQSAISGTGPVLFGPEVHELHDGTGFSYEGFALQAVSVRKDEQADTDPLHRRLDAILMLQDVWGRQAYVATGADYLIGDDHILIRQAVALPHYSKKSDIRFLVVPSSRMVSLKTLKHLPITELYRLGAENSLLHEELATLPATERGKYNLVVFNMIRSKAEDTLKIYISGDDHMERAQSSDRLILNSNGWLSTVIDGMFQVNSSPAYRFHVALERDGTVHDVGLFSSSFQE